MYFGLNLIYTDLRKIIMKKLLIILLFIPLISFGQETEKVYLITTKSGRVIKSKNYRINEDKGVVDIQKLDGKFIRFKTFNIVSYILLVDGKLPPPPPPVIEESYDSVFDEWDEREDEDEFGDKTGESYKYMITEDGVFSNSATTNSQLTGLFMVRNNSLDIGIVEYGSSPAKSYKHTFELVKIKQPNGNIVEIKRVYFSKNGALSFEKKQFKEIKKTLSLKGDYTMIFKRSGGFSPSRYRLKFSM